MQKYNIAIFLALIVVYVMGAWAGETANPSTYNSTSSLLN